MPRDLNSPKYQHMRALIVAARKANGLTQAEVAAALRRPQSYVADIERRERRIDIIEFLDLAEAIKFDPLAMLEKIFLTNRDGGATS